MLKAPPLKSLVLHLSVIKIDPTECLYMLEKVLKKVDNGICSIKKFDNPMPDIVSDINPIKIIRHKPF